RAGHEIAFVIAVAVSFAVRVVLVHYAMISSGSSRHLFEALGKDSFTGSFESHDFSRVGTLRRGILRMGAVDVEAPPISQHLLQLPLVLGVGPLPLPLDLEATRSEQRVLIFIVPDGQRGRQTWIVPDDGNAMGGGSRGGWLA